MTLHSHTVGGVVFPVVLGFTLVFTISPLHEVVKPLWLSLGVLAFFRSSILGLHVHARASVREVLIIFLLRGPMSPWWRRPPVSSVSCWRMLWCICFRHLCLPMFLVSQSPELGDERCAKRSGCARQLVTFDRRRRELGCRSSMVEKVARDCRQQCCSVVRLELDDGATAFVRFQLLQARVPLVT